MKSNSIMRKIYSDASAIVEAIQKEQLKLTEVCLPFLAAIEQFEMDINAFVAFDPAVIEHQIKANAINPTQGILAGIPIGIKDIIDTVDYPTEYYSAIYRSNWPSRDAHVVTLLKQAGAVIMGKTHTTEFAYMHTGPTRNPYDLHRTPGSSSAGSAAGVAAGFFPLALGTQTAGSLIKPASYCGLCAFKPTFGLVSLEGIKPLAPSFDTLGWFGHSVRDLELLARVLIPNMPEKERKNRTLKLVFCQMPGWDRVEPEVEKALSEVVESLRIKGHIVEKVILPVEWAKGYDAHQIINDCETSRSLWKEKQQHGALLSPEMQALFLRSQSISWAEESAAHNQLAELRPAVEKMVGSFDIVLTASTANVAPIGLAQTGSSDFIKFWTAFGLPQINLPVFITPGALPIGLQLIGRWRYDAQLLADAEQLHRDMQRR
ncbi:amidase [Serratia marcescens]|uniref:amidase n=1 Tax=Serratia marcescens TaxID=615 RepID=UPI003204C57C